MMVVDGATWEGDVKKIAVMTVAMKSKVASIVAEDLRQLA